MEKTGSRAKKAGFRLVVLGPRVLVSSLSSFPSSAWERKAPKLCFAGTASPERMVPFGRCRCDEAELRGLRSQAELGNEAQRGHEARPPLLFVVPRYLSGVRNQSRCMPRIVWGAGMTSPVSCSMAQPHALLTGFGEGFPSAKCWRKLGRASFAFSRPSVMAAIRRTWGY